ncbi:hypothetical protein [Paraliomyxa miuraensis]|uniref:hypothetical protein n=1 Tax=Paraliomyxa miuraensis TaxID=376150 RepID=UPI0022563E42|nr:hypothetical protein [Paraliomyxa miuraensis]
MSDPKFQYSYTIVSMDPETQATPGGVRQARVERVEHFVSLLLESKSIEYLGQYDEDGRAAHANVRVGVVPL